MSDSPGSQRYNLRSNSPKKLTDDPATDLGRKTLYPEQHMKENLECSAADREEGVPHEDGGNIFIKEGKSQSVEAFDDKHICRKNTINTGQIADKVTVIGDDEPDGGKKLRDRKKYKENRIPTGETLPSTNKIRHKQKNVRIQKGETAGHNPVPLFFQLLILLIVFGGLTYILNIDVVRYLQLQNLSSVFDKNFPSFSKDSKTALFQSRPVAHRYGNLTVELGHIQEKYTDFGDNFWDLIAGSSWSHVQGGRDANHPVVLMLVGQPESSNLQTVAHDIAKLFSKVFTHSDQGIIQIDGTKEAAKDMGHAKLDMDNTLKDGFERGSKVALVARFDQLPPCSIMLFHSYCDNDNAPYKDAVIIFTVQLKTPVSNGAQPKDVDELVQEHLTRLWVGCPEELTQDKIMAMHSRVSNNVALVK